MSNSEPGQQPENPYIFHNRSDPNCETNKEIQRLRNLVRVGDLVRIEPNGMKDENLIPTWHRSYIGEVGVIVGENFSKDGNSTYEILLGNGTLLERVYLLDFVMVQPAARK